MSTGSVSSLDSSSGGGKDDNVERLFKVFTFKCLQVIIQSRTECQPCRPVSKDVASAEYFCITIPDNPSIDEHIRRALDGVRSFPVREQSVCVEIPLLTTDGDQMFLEAWDINFSTSSLDTSAHKIQHIFTRMGVTLKSLLSATRAMPAYRLARNQGEKEGGYRLKYRMYLGKPQTHHLGEGFRTTHAGSVPTAYGLFSVNVSFRTKLLLSPDMSASTFEVTDNYFHKEDRVVATSPASPRLSNTKAHSPPHKSPSFEREGPNFFAVSPAVLDNDDSVWTRSSAINMEEFPEPVVGAFSLLQKPGRQQSEPQMPFESLMKKSFLARQGHQALAADSPGGVQGTDWEHDEHDTPVEAEELSHFGNVDTKENVSTSLKNVHRMSAVEDEFVLVDRPPFAADEDPRDVKSFLSIMFRPANLYESTDQRVALADYLSDFEILVSKLEKDMPELDEFCQSVISTHSKDDDEETFSSRRKHPSLY